MAVGILKFIYYCLTGKFHFHNNNVRASKALMGLIKKIILIVLVFISLPATVTADEDLRVHRLKAAFIYNFTKFVMWPPQVSNSDAELFNICILGDDRLTVAANTIQGKSVHGKYLHIKNILNTEGNGECDIIFLAVSDTERLQQRLESIKGTSILTIGDSSTFVDRGGMIGLFVKNNKVRFDINQLAANDSGLKINSRLLELANRVIQ